jgi:hypothetical protein
VARHVSTTSSDRKSRIIRNAPKLWHPSTFGGIDLHAKFDIKIRCVGQVIVAPASRPVARHVVSPVSVEKSRLLEMLRNFAGTFYMYCGNIMQKIGLKLVFPPRFPLFSVRTKPTLRKITKNSYDVEIILFFVGLILILCLTIMQKIMKKFEV